MEKFGHYLRGLRLKKRIGLRDFAKMLDILPSNLCHLETGRLNAPQNKKFLEKIMKVLDIKDMSKEQERLFDLAAKPGEIPQDVKEYFCENNIAEELPVMARTIKNRKMTKDEIKKLIESLAKK